MTPTRTLAASLARTVVDQIESSKSIITQNIEEAIHDALLLAEAKERGAIRDLTAPSSELAELLGKNVIFTRPNPDVSPTVPCWGSLLNWWQDDQRLRDEDE